MKQLKHCVSRKAAERHPGEAALVLLRVQPYIRRLLNGRHSIGLRVSERLSQPPVSARYWFSISETSQFSHEQRPIGDEIVPAIDSFELPRRISARLEPRGQALLGCPAIRTYGIGLAVIFCITFFRSSAEVDQFHRRSIIGAFPYLLSTVWFFYAQSRPGWSSLLGQTMWSFEDLLS